MRSTVVHPVSAHNGLLPTHHYTLHQQEEAFQYTTAITQGTADTMGGRERLSSSSSSTLDATEFTEREIAGLREIFSMFDKDGDGTISATEIMTALQSTGAKSSDDDLNRLLQEYDADGDGSFSFNEFLELVARSSDTVRQLQEDAVLRQAFDLMDRNGDGYLTEREIYEVMRSMGENVTKAEVRRIVRNTDFNGDGKIEFKEFARVMKANNTQ